MSRFAYCLNGSTIRTTPVMTQIEAAGRAGYAAIELWHDKLDEHLSGGGALSEVKQALDDHGLAVPTTIYLPGWFDADEGSYGQVFEECKRRMDHAVQLGASYIIASPPAGPADYDLGAERYRHLLETGCAMGVKPSMEFLGFVDQLNTIEDAMQVMEKSGHPEATTILDPFHIFRGGGSMESIAKLSASQIAVSHFNDAPQDPPREVQHDHNRVMPGEGHLDLRRYVDLLSGTGYNGYLSLELFREELWTQDPFEVARWGLEKMRATVEG